LTSRIKESSVSIREHNQEPARPAPRPAPAPATGETRRSGLVGRVQNMLQEVVAEIRKVTWPTQLETRNLTIVVIGISVLVGGLLGIIDLLLTGLIQLLTNGAVGL
jgi:preprotein translocase SecE subunit